MSRHFEPISKKELQKKVESYIQNDCLDVRHITPTVEKDLDKVHFDTENLYYKDYPFDLVGYNDLSNGMSFLGVMSGGDWENPVFFIIYWDGKKLRGYVPKEGNLWNTDTNEAYGNDEDADIKNCKKRWPDDPYFQGDYVDLEGLDNYDVAIKKDIMERIQEKPLTKPKKDSKVKACPPSGLSFYTNKELLDELERRVEQSAKRDKDLVQAIKKRVKNGK